MCNVYLKSLPKNIPIHQLAYKCIYRFDIYVDKNTIMCYESNLVPHKI